MVGSRRDYGSFGVENGDEHRVAGVDHATGTVMLEGRSGEAIPRRPRRVGGRRWAAEVCHTEAIEPRAGGCIHRIRNDAGPGRADSRTADARSVEGGRVSFRLEDGRRPAFGKDAPQPRRLDHLGVEPGGVSEPRRPGKSITVWNGRRCTESLAVDRRSFGLMRPIRDPLNHDRRLLPAVETIDEEPNMRRTT